MAGVKRLYTINFWIYQLGAYEKNEKNTDRNNTILEFWRKPVKICMRASAVTVSRAAMAPKQVPLMYETRHQRLGTEGPRYPIANPSPNASPGPA